MKLYLSNSGIYSSTKYQFSDAKSNLSTSKNNTGGSPSSFAYSGYVNSSLPNIISTYMKNVEELEKLADEAEKRYDELNSNGETMFDNISEFTIKERTGLKAKVDLEQKYALGDLGVSEGKGVAYSNESVQLQEAEGPLGEHSVSGESAVITNEASGITTAQSSGQNVDDSVSSEIASVATENPNETNNQTITSDPLENANTNSSSPSAVGISIPSDVKQTGITKNYTNYDYFYNKWSNNTNQRVVADRWNEAGRTSSNGIATIDDRYLVAVSPKFGTVGDNIDVVLEDGTVINCTIADAKGSDATSEWGHRLGNSGVDVIEWESVGSQDVIDIGDWKGKEVSSIINLNNQV